MKKLFVLVLVFMLLLAPAAPAEGAPEPHAAEGDWYAELGGLPLRLSLNADGAYSLGFPEGLASSLAGAWTAEDVFVRLEDAGELTLVSEDLLLWPDQGLCFTREAPRAYSPAELLEGAVPELYEGYWRCAFVDLDGAAVPAEAADERTDLFIEADRAALGGPRFGDIFWGFGFADGTLSAEVNGRPVTLALQQDGLLRLTLDGNTLYLVRAAAGDPGEGA